MPILYLDIGDRVIGINALAAEDLRARASRTAEGVDLAWLFETPAPIRAARLSAAERQTLDKILQLWIEEVGIDQLWPALRELHQALGRQ